MQTVGNNAVTQPERSGLIEVRFHGRGGQGNVAASWLLAAAVIREGRFAQAFPAFGAERRGAPVVAYVRMARYRLRRRSSVLHPTFLIVQDSGLLSVPGVLDGLVGGGAVLVNSHEPSESLTHRLGVPAVALPAEDMAREVLGRPVPNTALLSAFVTLTGLLSRESLEAEVAERFAGKGEETVNRNIALIRRAAEAVPAFGWKEASNAARA